MGWDVETLGFGEAACFLEVGGDQAAALLVVADEPDVDGLGVEHTVGVEDEEAAAGAEDAIDFAEGLDGVGDVLHGDGDDDGVETSVEEGEGAVLVGVVDEVVFEVGVVLHLDGVEAQTDHALFGVVLGPVGTVAAEEVKNLGVGGYEEADEVGDGGDCAVVDVDEQAGLPIEEGVAAFVLAAEVVAGEEFLPAEVPIGA